MTRRVKTAALLVIGLALISLCIMDRAEVWRPSGLSALACAPALVVPQPDADALIPQYRARIAGEAEAHDLPPELLGAVIVDHQRHQSNFRRFTDCFGSALGANLSLGLAQIRISTAALLDGSTLDRLSAPEFRQLRRELLAPESNIAYAARELRSLLERPNRFPGIGAAELIHDPFRMALVLSEYRTGRLPTEARESRLSANAFSALEVLMDGMLEQFGRDAGDAARVKTEVRDYLQYISCDSGIFNTEVCEQWTRSRAVSAGALQ